MSSRKISALGCALTLALSGCALGADHADRTGGGTALQPKLAPTGKLARGGKDRRRGGSAGDRAGSAGGSRSGDRDAPSPAEPAGAPSPTDPASVPPTDQAGDQPSEGAGGPAESGTASLSDPPGDASGLGAPDHVDLTAARLMREGDAFTLTVTAAGAFPGRQDGDRTTNVIGFFDVDGDGAVDYEVWGTLADDGWNPTWRHPDGAAFGSASGVVVQGSGDQVTFRFAPRHMGGADAFRWIVGAEDGTLEQVATGTSARDYAPDSGGAAFPAR